MMLVTDIQKAKQERMMNFDNDENLLELVGKRMKEARLKANLSQDDLASRLEMSQQLISHYERGLRPIKIDMLLSIAMICGVSFNYFFTESNEILEGIQILDKLDSTYRTVALEHLKSLSKLQAMPSI